MSESHKRISGSASKDTQIEHSITRDKVKDLMAKLKKVRSFRQPPQSSASNLQRKGTAKVLILDSRASSRLLPSSSRASPLPQSQFNEVSRLSTAQRKLVFSSNDDHGCCHCHQSSRTPKPGSKRSVRAMAAKRAHSPEVDTPVLGREHFSRIKMDEPDGVFHHHSEFGRVPTIPHPPRPSGVGGASVVPHPPDIEGRRKASKRMRRNSHVEGSHKTTGISTDPLSDLSKNLSRLGLLNSKDSSNTTPRGNESTQRDSSCLLPRVSSGLGPVSLTAASSNHSRVASNTLNINHGSGSHLPPIARSNYTTKPAGKRKNRCIQCSKKIGLASTYTCRCGGMFCAAHRYAESHSCTFDYKAEGRRMLARNNPVVTAPKLPKI